MFLTWQLTARQVDIWHLKFDTKVGLLIIIIDKNTINMMFFCYLFVILVLSEEANCLKNIHNARIFNGQNALENQFPWHIFIKVTFKDKTNEKGGGVLISKKHFLTCAHLFYHR